MTQATPPTQPAIPIRWVKVNHHSAAHIAAHYNYAAYGSNLSLEQMTARCNAADIVGAATLEDAELIFAYYASIKIKRGARVPIGIYKLDAWDVAALDRREGLGRSYDRYLVTVTDAAGNQYRCFTYIKIDQRLEKPSDAYYTRCAMGYNDWQFDKDVLVKAREKAPQWRQPVAKEGPIRSASTYTTGNYFNQGFLTSSAHGSEWQALRSTPQAVSYESHEPISEPGVPTKHNRTRSLVTGRFISGHHYRTPETYCVRCEKTHASEYCDDGASRHSVTSYPYRYEPHRPSAERIVSEALERIRQQDRAYTINDKGSDTFTNPRTGERWVKGPRGYWIRIDD